MHRLFLLCLLLACSKTSDDLSNDTSTNPTMDGGAIDADEASDSDGATDADAGTMDADADGSTDTDADADGDDTSATDADADADGDDTSAAGADDDGSTEPDADADGSATGDDGSTDADGSVGTPCAELDSSTCRADDTCVVIFGLTPATDGDIECIDHSLPARAVGCMDVGTACGEAETYAMDPIAGTCMWFSDTCVPEGWESCSGLDFCPDDGSTDGDSDGDSDGDGDGGAIHSACASMDIDVCRTEPRCKVISGSPVDVEAECDGTLEPEEVGCIHSTSTCDDAMTWASGPDGICMEFPSTCIPHTWTRCDPLDSCETGDDDDVVIVEPDVDADGAADEGGGDDSRLLAIAVSPCPLETSGDPVDLMALSFEPGVLALNVSHSGGCGDHEYQLCWGGDLVPDTLIPEVHLKFSHFNRDDACEAMVSETLRYDLSVLYPETGTSGFNVRVMTSIDSYLTGLYDLGSAAE